MAALKWYELVASSPANDDYGAACNNIGYIYDGGGAGVVCDYSKAASWYLKGAEAGDDHAQYHLALLYKNGRGVPKDLAAARSWFQKSAAQKEPDSMFELGLMMVKGEGGDKDEKFGVSLIFESSELGNDEATESVQKIVIAAIE